MPSAKQWRLRLRTAQAMAVLCWARLLVALVPFERWRGLLGAPDDGRVRPPEDSLADARRFARRVERAAAWLPFTTKCLPRAIALSRILSRRKIGHTVVFAVRPAPLRTGPDALHAWVETESTKIIGDLPGPWLETLRLRG